MSNQVRFIRAVRSGALDLTRRGAVIVAQLDADGYDRIMPPKAAKVGISCYTPSVAARYSLFAPREINKDVSAVFPRYRLGWSLTAHILHTSDHCITSSTLSPGMVR